MTQPTPSHREAIKEFSRGIAAQRRPPVDPPPTLHPRIAKRCQIPRQRPRPDHGANAARCKANEPPLDRICPDKRFGYIAFAPHKTYLGPNGKLTITPMLPKLLDQIASADLTALVTNGVREGRTIEYKEQLPGGRDKDKKEFLADVSSFANAAGGDLIYGVVEHRDASNKTTGVPKAVVGVGAINVDEVTRRLENMIRDGIEPRIPGLQTKSIDDFSNGPAIILRIPRSWAGPHMVAYKASPRFFSRTSAGKMPLDVAEIRAAFVQSELLPDRIRRFREERIGRILARETPIPLQPGAAIVLHLVPIPTFQSGVAVDVLACNRGQPQLRPIGGHSYGRRLNLDGFVTHGTGTADDPPYGYTQLFRHGAIEAVDKLLLHHHEGRRFIPSVAYEKELIQAFRNYLTAFSQLTIHPPIVVMLSFLGVNGYWMSNRNIDSAQNVIDRDVLLVPELVVENIDENEPRLLRPVFDMVWQACGLERSRNYDENGEGTAG